MAVQKKYQALGRGLDALIATGEVKTSGSSSIGEISVSLIVPNPNQPRRDFSDKSLDELADSIKELGIVQPITLRNMGDGSYQIIAGERRWRAAQRAGLKTVPAYIRTADDEKTMQMALVENIQREDLNPIEIALAYQGLIEQYGLKQEELSAKVGKKRATVTNYLRLLKLPAQVQMALKNNVERIGLDEAFIKVTLPNGEKKKIMHDMPDHKEGVNFVFQCLLNPEFGAIKSLDEIDAVGHRIVQGGDLFEKSVIVDKSVEDGIESLCDLAPVHNAGHLKGLRAVDKLMPNTPQVCVFDNAFHSTMPD